MLTPAERAAIDAARTSWDQTVRGRACAIVMSAGPADRDEARRLLGEAYLEATVPSFHLIPRGDAMLGEDRFARAYRVLAETTDGFADVSEEKLLMALVSAPAAIGPLRMIAGLTRNELAVAVKLVTGNAVSGARIGALEREQEAPPSGSSAWGRRLDQLKLVARTIIAVVAREVLEVPAAAAESFHSKLDKRDTISGWSGVERDAREGVPYHALLYQRYVGGLWRQVQDAYSEIKGDGILEAPLERLLIEERIPFWRTATGASGAKETARRYGFEPGPDFLIPAESPQVIIESKVAEDGGTVRDKAARIKTLGSVAATRGLILCALIDGKGWSERVSALADVVLATQGRTFSLSSLPGLLQVPEVAAWRGRA